LKGERPNRHGMVEEWRALAARIDGLLRAGEFLVSAFRVHGNDERQAFRKSLLPEFKAITDAISELGEGHGTELPPKAFQALNRYRSYDWHGQVATLGASDSTYAIQVLAPIAAFRSEFKYLIRDAEFDGRSLTELAFEHLRRQIVVDDDVRNKWNAAYNRHEPACKRLGAVHLLSHGIWAFKITAPGAATDLVSCNHDS
jgi:hypothetical protein